MNDLSQLSLRTSAADLDSTTRAVASADVGGLHLVGPHCFGYAQPSSIKASP